jgi:hypothetical protein
MTRQFCSAYYGATKKEKPAVARGLVQCIQNLNPPGRFLKHSLGGWEEATASVAQEKASQSLRDTVASVLKEANIQDGTHPKKEVFTQKCLDELHPGSSRHPKSATKDSVLFQDSTEQLPNGIARSYQESESSCQVRMPDSLAVNFGDQMLLSMDATSSISLQEEFNENGLQEEFNENGKRSGISFLEADLNSKIQRFSTDRAFCTMGLIDNSDFCSMANSKPQYQISPQVTTSREPCTTSTKLSFDTWTGNGGFSLNDAARYAHLAAQRKRQFSTSINSESKEDQENELFSADALDSIVWDDDDIKLDSTSSFQLAPGQHQAASAWDDEDAFRRRIRNLLQEL